MVEELGAIDVNPYRRSIALIPVDEENAYLFDLFEVTGGTQRDYLLHGDADDEQYLIANYPLEATTGGYPDHSPISVQREQDKYSDLSMLHIDSHTRFDHPVEVEFRYRNPQIVPRLKLHVLQKGGAYELLTGSSSSIRHSGELEKNLENQQAVCFIVRNQSGQKDINFVSLLEPYQGAPLIHATKRIFERLPKQVIAVEVHHRRGEDLILVDQRKKSETIKL